MRRYAEATSVPISRSRADIDDLLRDWGCNAIQWSDDYKNGKITLRFVWPHQNNHFMARLHLNLPSDADIRKEAIDGRSMTKINENKYLKLLKERGKREVRCLLLWLKGCLNAVDTGIVKAEEIFLPFLEDVNGRTVAEIAVPKLGQLLVGSASRMLPETTNHTAVEVIE